MRILARDATLGTSPRNRSCVSTTVSGAKFRDRSKTVKRPSLRRVFLNFHLLPTPPGATFARSMSDIPTDISHDQYAVRLKKLQDLRAAGNDPFRANFSPTHFSAEALKAYVDGQDNTV